MNDTPLHIEKVNIDLAKIFAFVEKHHFCKPNITYNNYFISIKFNHIVHKKISIKYSYDTRDVFLSAATISLPQAHNTKRINTFNLLKFFNDIYSDIYKNFEHISFFKTSDYKKMKKDDFYSQWMHIRKKIIYDLTKESEILKRIIPHIIHDYEKGAFYNYIKPALPDQYHSFNAYCYPSNPKNSEIIALQEKAKKAFKAKAYQNVMNLLSNQEMLPPLLLTMLKHARNKFTSKEMSQFPYYNEMQQKITIADECIKSKAYSHALALLSPYKQLLSLETHNNYQNIKFKLQTILQELSIKEVENFATDLETYTTTVPTNKIKEFLTNINNIHHIMCLYKIAHYAMHLEAGSFSIYWFHPNIIFHLYIHFPSQESDCFGIRLQKGNSDTGLEIDTIEVANEEYFHSLPHHQSNVQHWSAIDKKLSYTNHNNKLAHTIELLENNLAKNIADIIEPYYKNREGIKEIYIHDFHTHYEYVFNAYPNNMRIRNAMGNNGIYATILFIKQKDHITSITILVTGEIRIHTTETSNYITNTAKGKLRDNLALFITNINRYVPQMHKTKTYTLPKENDTIFLYALASNGLYVEKNSIKNIPNNKELKYLYDLAVQLANRIKNIER